MPLYIVHAYRNGFQGLAVSFMWWQCCGQANVFTRKSTECGWASRISTLLDISVSQSDLLQLVAIERRAHRHQIKGELETAIMIAEDNLLTMHLIASSFTEEHGQFTISENSVKIWRMRQQWIPGSVSFPHIN